MLRPPSGPQSLLSSAQARRGCFCFFFSFIISLCPPLVFFLQKKLEGGRFSILIKQKRPLGREFD
jgi:hypothetical protein